MRPAPPDADFTKGECMSERAADEASSWPGGIAAITLFVEDLAAARSFYRDVFDAPMVYEDDASAVFRFGDTLVNLPKSTEAPELVAPAPVASPQDGVRYQLTLAVDDVDATCKELERRGVDRPWGIRTASFRDPGGHVWEIAH